MSDTIQIGIVGGSGYSGGELIRLLLNHPRARIAWVTSRGEKRSRRRRDTSPTRRAGPRSAAADSPETTELTVAIARNENGPISTPGSTSIAFDGVCRLR